MKNRSLHSVPALIVAVVFAIGILVGKKIELPMEVLFATAATLLISSIVLFAYSKKNQTVQPFLAISLVALVVALGVAAIGLSRSPAELHDIENNRVVQIVGRIIEPPTTIENRTRFTLKAETISDSSGTRSLPTNVLVTVVRRKRDSLAISFPYGSAIQLKGQIGRPSAERNPGEFDARKYYEAQGISFVMRVRGYANVTIVDSTTTRNAFEWVMKHVVVPVRSYMLTQIDQMVGGEEGDLLKGIYIGERSGISYATRTAFTNSGISHVLAVSGSNVVVVLVFFSTLFKLIRFRRTANILATLVAVLFYMLLTGSQPPIVRATVMTFVFQFGKLFGEKSNGLNSLGVAALLILGYDARQLFDVGFQLSFAAVASLVYCYPIAKSWLPKIQESSLVKKLVARSVELAVATFVATIGTLPMIAVYFGKVSVVGLLTNIFIVPAVGASVILGFMSSLIGWANVFIADKFAAVNWVLLKLSLIVADFSGSLSWAYVETLQFKPVHSLPFYMLLGVLFHLHVKHVARTFFVALLASLNIALVSRTTTFEKSSEGKLRVSFIDVGQGDGALIEFPNSETMLIDAGPWSEEYDTGERIVEPFLKRRGIQTIDYLVASHPHGDHIGGFPHIFKKFDVKEVIESGQPSRDPTYAFYIQAIRNEGCRVDTARSNEAPLEIGGAKLYMLYPTTTFIDPDTTHPHENLNNTSIVFKLCFGETSILFTGDAERDAEAEMLVLHGEFLHSTILKTGHHGSRTSSTQEFVEAVRPQHAIVSVGLNNTFNHPSEEVLERLRSLNVETLRTDEEGAIIFESDGTTFQRIEWR